MDDKVSEEAMARFLSPSSGTKLTKDPKYRRRKGRPQALIIEPQRKWMSKGMQCIQEGKMIRQDIDSKTSPVHTWHPWLTLLLPWEDFTVFNVMYRRSGGWFVGDKETIQHQLKPSQNIVTQNGRKESYVLPMVDLDEIENVSFSPVKKLPFFAEWTLADDYFGILYHEKKKSEEGKEICRFCKSLSRTANYDNYWRDEYGKRVGNLCVCVTGVKGVVECKIDEARDKLVHFEKCLQTLLTGGVLSSK